ncbi:MAG: S8 family peptidase [Chloroflexota bacterium]|nr:S8 family peptidase [Chloroflexota bacterium]
MASRLRADPDVRYVEPNYIYRASVRPNDQFYDRLYALPRIGAEQAWERTTGNPQILIAVVDTGVYAGHPDLGQNIVQGTDLVNRDNDASDDEGHGTHTAGVIAAIGNNERGVAGMCWQCRVLAVKALDAQGEGTAVQVAAGIRYAADKGAKVINLSLGGEFDSQLLHDAIIYATRAGALVVVAAGNEAEEGNPVEYPAAYSEVISVAATDENDAHAFFSNYGSYVDIAAPGVRIGSTLWDPDEAEIYGEATGTSEAAPFVAGLAGLIWSANPSLTNADVRRLLLENADDLGPSGRDDYFGAGRINAYRAVMAAAPQPAPQPQPPAPQPPAPQPPAPQPPAPQPGDVITFPETGHTLRGEFRRFWEANGGLPVFGFPITEELSEQTAEGTFLVQYFERNRFEFHPEKPAPYNVLLGRLGDTLLRRGGVDWWGLPKGQQQAGCQFFAETGHSLCEPFLSYWRSHGLRDGRLDDFGRSLALFGLPLSEPRMETNASGHTVLTQWFERARFEDHGSAPGGPGVLLGLLGNELGTPPPGAGRPAAPVP